MFIKLSVFQPITPLEKIGYSLLISLKWTVFKKTDNFSRYLGWCVYEKMLLYALLQNSFISEIGSVNYLEIIDLQIPISPKWNWFGKMSIGAFSFIWMSLPKLPSTKMIH